ncbi:FecR family protein [Bradyrhizobium sp. SRL28]|uniref:FecR family protein n=1 Tax=Bradyrhizobium sp. SRL28 TaxID=2836178 RepID=UPI001BDE80C9|nr:FecR family protein [Bradyrhizobium sp. SRL28]MBT1509592.1 FecR family protein [Bradyrhizobium sp. SRL28]
MSLNENGGKPEALLDEAASWLLRLREAAGDARVQDDFSAWLSRSSEHRAAWHRVRESWHLLGESKPVYEHVWRPRSLQTTSTGAGKGSRVQPGNQSRATRRRWQWVATISAAGLAACLLVVAVPSLLLRLEADYLTTTAQSRLVTLEDGTTVYLAADSAIKTDFSASRRQVQLLAGEAFFDVTRNPARPFIVDASGVKVEVTGTAFDVRLASSVTQVELARGAVGVSSNAAPRTSPAVLAPGQMLVVDRKSGAMTKSDIAPEDIGAWREGRLFVNDATIGAVVEQIQRYHAAWIAVPDVTLAQQTVTGLYDLRDPDRALRALVQPYGGKVHEVSRFARIVSRL